MNRLVKLMLATSLGFLTTVVFVPAYAQAIEPTIGVELYPHYYHHRSGVEIVSVGYRSPAALAGLQPGDVIVAVDGREVRTPKELHHALYRSGHRGALTVRNVRTGRFVRVHVFPTAGNIGVTVVPVRAVVARGL